MSNRQRKKNVAQGVRRLKAKPGWDPASRVRESPEGAMARLDQESRSGKVYAEGEACQACVAARAEDGDESALCDAHLAAAMGF